MGEQLFLERFFWFDSETGNHRYPNAARLARRFECSPKTAQRSIEFFRCRLHAPLAYDPEKRGYYYTDPDFQLSALRLSEQELLALLVSKKLLSDAAAGPLGDELGRIAEKLSVMLSEHVSPHADPDRIFSFRSTEFNPADPSLFRCVSNALLMSRLLSFRYYSPASNSFTSRIVEPHHLVNYMGTWHLIAFCRLRNDWRDFLLSRMGSCEARNEEFSPRRDSAWRPLLTETFGIFQNRENFSVTIRFSPLRSRWIRGQVWHKDQKMEELPGGGLQLTVPVSHEVEITMEILKHGAHAEVLAPGWLREKVKEEIEKMQKKYCT